MDGGSVTSKGQVTIPKRVRDALGIKAGTRVRFKAQGSSARLTVVRTRTPSRVEDGPQILNYKGPRLAIAEMDGGYAMRKAAKRARG